MASHFAFAALTRMVLHLLEAQRPRHDAATTPDFNSHAALIHLLEGVRDARSH